MRNGIQVFASSRNITKYLVTETLSKKEVLNNNRNTCTASFVNVDIYEGQEITIYEGLQLLQPLLVGEKKMFIDETYELENKLIVGQEIMLGLHHRNEKAIIEAVDHEAKTIDLVEPVKQSYTVRSWVGSYFFRGYADQPQQTDIGKVCVQGGDTLTLVKMIGIEKGADRKTVIGAYSDKYFREILGEIVQDFVALDTEKSVFDGEGHFTKTSGDVWNESKDYTAKRRSGTVCQRIKIGGTTNASILKSIGHTNANDFSHFRFWFRVGKNYGGSLAGIKIGLGQENDYRVRTIDRVGEENEDCWHYEAVNIQDNFTTVGNPNLIDITHCHFFFESTGVVDDILIDRMSFTSGGFTIQNAKRGLQKYSDVRFKGDKVSLVIEELAKLVDHYWFVDYNKDIHYYYKNGESISTFVVGERDAKYSSRQIDVDASGVINRQLVEGAEAPSEGLYRQQRVADGEQKSFILDYKPAGKRKLDDGSFLQGLEVFVGGTKRSVGVEGLDSEEDFDFICSYQEKVIRNGSNYAPLQAGQKIEMVYYPRKTVSVRHSDNSSITRMKALNGGDGIYEGQIIIDKKIKSTQEARQRAKIEVDTKKHPIITTTFTTDVGGLGLGQMVRVVDSHREIDDYFQIQEISAKSKVGSMMVYTVIATSYLYGYVEFFQMLLKKSSVLEIGNMSLIFIPQNIDEVLSIKDKYVLTKEDAAEEVAASFHKRFVFDNETHGIGSVTGGHIGSQNSQRIRLKGGNGTIDITDGTNPHSERKVMRIESQNGTQQVITEKMGLGGNPMTLHLWTVYGGQSGAATVAIEQFDKYEPTLPTQTDVFDIATSGNHLFDDSIDFVPLSNTICYRLKVTVTGSNTVELEKMLVTEGIEKTYTEPLANFTSAQ